MGVNAVPVIRDATFATDIEALRALFLEYQAATGVDLCFRNFRDELATLPGAYARPSGRLLSGSGGP